MQYLSEGDDGCIDDKSCRFTSYDSIVEVNIQDVDSGKDIRTSQLE